MRFFIFAQLFFYFQIFPFWKHLETFGNILYIFFAIFYFCPIILFPKVSKMEIFGNIWKYYRFFFAIFYFCPIILFPKVSKMEIFGNNTVFFCDFLFLPNNFISKSFQNGNIWKYYSFFLRFFIFAQ